MEIKELQKAAAKLEMELTKVIADIVSDFGERTGFYPRRIEVELFETTAVGDLQKSYVVGGVKVKIDSGL